MERRLFLTGSMASEKSKFLRELLCVKAIKAGGYYTDMALGENGMLLGLELYPAMALADEAMREGELYLDCRSFPPTHDNEVFRTSGVRLLQEAEYYPFAIIDEFGGYEMIIPQYREALLSILNGETPCIGTIKPVNEADMMRQSLGLGERVNEHILSLWAMLEEDADTRIINLDVFEKTSAESIIKAWIEEYC